MIDRKKEKCRCSFYAGFGRQAEDHAVRGHEAWMDHQGHPHRGQCEAGRRQGCRSPRQPLQGAPQGVNPFDSSIAGHWGHEFQVIFKLHLYIST